VQILPACPPDPALSRSRCNELRMKNIYNEKDMMIKATGIYTLEDVTVEGVGTGSLTIKIDHNGLTIICGTESLKGLGGKGTLTAYSSIWFGYNIEALFN